MGPFPNAEFPLWALSPMQNFPFSTEKWPHGGGHFGSILARFSAPMRAAHRGPRGGPGGWRPFRAPPSVDLFWNRATLKSLIKDSRFFDFFSAAVGFWARPGSIAPLDPRPPESPSRARGQKGVGRGGSHLTRARVRLRARPCLYIKDKFHYESRTVTI